MRDFIWFLIVLVIPGAFSWLKYSIAHRIFLVASNLLALPAILEAERQELWFEMSFLIIMSCISFAYHVTYGWIPFWGDWFRRIDWTLAMLTAPIFLNFFFLHKYSYTKLMLNFWTLLLLTLAVDLFMRVSLTYAILLGFYVLALFFTRRRHLSKIPKKSALAIVFWTVVGVSFFYLSDVTIYWIFHTYWHLLIFYGIYLFLKLGPLDDAEKKTKERESQNTQALNCVRENTQEMLYV